MIRFIKKCAPEKTILAIGNPPYQEEDGGAQSSARPVYNLFVEQLMDNPAIDEFSLVIPARWFAGGKNLDSFRRRMAQCGQVKQLHYFEKSEDIFPTVQISGGVCFLNWQRSYRGKAIYVFRGKRHRIDLAHYDIIPDDPYAYSIVDKILAASGQAFVSERAWSRKPYGLEAAYFKNRNSPARGADMVLCHLQGRKTTQISRQAIRRNAHTIDQWKVAIPAAYGAKRTLPTRQIFLIKKNEITTESYTIVDCFSSKGQAENFITYLQTDFCRYLLGLRKLSQHIPKDRWSWVPVMDVNRCWTSSQLAKTFGLSRIEQQHIARKVDEWS